MPDRSTPSDALGRLNAALEGRYRIERELGEGGMATVYLAEDLKHRRNVALKVLKPQLAAVVGAERFLAEIETTAHLQHPHILPLFDSGEADPFLFYVMPYVEGESLRERLDRDHELPVEEAVKIATAVAGALDYAHDHGVIHRDIKPANILLHAGEPVVSDFGIALAVGAAGGGRLTETGLSLGTPHYMSPEQATGDLNVGPSTDIYALGCVLYETLVGEPPYTGSTPQAVLGKVIQAKPVSATEARRSVPVNVDAAIRKALEKLPADRFASAKELARALADPAFRHGEAGLAGPAAGGGWTRRSVVFGSLFAVSTLLLVWSLLRTGPSAMPAQTVSFTVPVGEGADVYLGGVPAGAWGRPVSRSLALSPDGRLLAYIAWAPDPDGRVTSRLYLRRLDREEAVPLEGTEGASSPFFSPDGEWIGFLDDPALRRISVADRDVQTIAQDAALSQRTGRPFIAAGAAWSENGVIAYATADGVYRVAAAGGVPELILEPDTLPGEREGVGHPEWLPGGRALLLAGAKATGLEDTEIFAFDPATGTRTTVLTNAMDPHYVEPGILVFMRLGTLMAVGFDPGTLEVRGEPVAMAEDVMQALSMPNTNWNSGIGQLAISRAGHLAYASGGLYPPGLYTLWRVRADGTADSLPLDPRPYLQPRVSPDGRHVAFSAGTGATLDLFVHDFDRGITRRLNTGLLRSAGPEWSPDGRDLAFTAIREDGVRNIYRMPADGSEPPEPVAPSSQGQWMGSWSALRVIAYLQGGDIRILRPGGEPAPFVASENAEERYPTFSPDGRWLAYTVVQEGRQDVYVRPYPGPGPATLVSNNWGRSPAWSPDGRRLYYLGPEEDPPRWVMMAVDIDVSDGLRAGRPLPLIDPWSYATTVPTRFSDVADDGSFIAGRETDTDANRVERIHVVLNWFGELRERVPAR